MATRQARWPPADLYVVSTSDFNIGRMSREGIRRGDLPRRQ